jgi:hypothetical protein
VGVPCFLEGATAEGEETLTNNSFMFDKIMPLSEAAEGYELFDKMKVQQVVFKAQAEGTQ